MNKFELHTSETPDEEYKDLIEHYESLDAQERAKEKVEHSSHVEELEGLLAPLLKIELLRVLIAIKTEGEASASKERELAKKALTPVLDKIKFLDMRTNITKEELEELRKKYKIISNAVGIINSGMVDHSR